MLFPVKVLFRLGGFSFRSYSVLLSLGMAAGCASALSEAKRRQLSASTAEALIAAGLAGGLAGGFLYAAAQRAFDSWLGVDAPIGAVAYGGLCGGAILMLLYARCTRISWWPYADAFTPGVLCAIAIVRIGCFLNWDDYGVPTTVWWAVDGGDGPRHPTQLYLSFGALLLFAVAFRGRKRPRPDGVFFLSFAAAEAVLRFAIEWLRDEPRYALSLTAGQWTALAILAVSLPALRRKLATPAASTPGKPRRARQQALGL